MDLEDYEHDRVMANGADDHDDSHPAAIRQEDGIRRRHWWE